MRTVKSEKVKKAESKVKHYVDKIYDFYESNDFVEFRGVTGGDLVCFRVYDNGRICER